MGRSEPPFIYDRPATNSFYGPTDFNPKAVTEASRRPPPPRPIVKGPLVNINRHPDTWGSPELSSEWTPMSSRTKNAVVYIRRVQLVLRIFAFTGALGSLFCSIVMTNVATTIIWILRVAPGVAILHTLYAIYHLCRSPINRPPASQASYAVFASTLDAGLVPFYVFTAYMAHGEWITGTYRWGNLFNDASLTVKLAEATFICAVVSGGLHLISLSISVFLAVMFHKISQLPPDMNPLEDNLTARPRKTRKELEIEEKHLSASTFNSSLEDPLIGPPRSMPFMHTRGESFASDPNRGSVDGVNMKRQSVISVHSHRVPYMEPPSPHMSFQHPANQSYDLLPETHVAPEYHHVPMGSPEIVDAAIGNRRLASRTAERSNSVSPVSGNWIVYPEDTEETNNGAAPDVRQSSSVYSQRTISTTTSKGVNNFRDWFAYGQKSPNVGIAIPEDTRGEYSSLATREYYGIEDDEDKRELDLGDRQFNIFPDPEEYDHDRDQDEATSRDLPFNPLMLNPPTPQPILTNSVENTDPVRRDALVDSSAVPNQTQTPSTTNPQDSPRSPRSPTARARFYGNLNEEGKPGLDMSRHVSHQEAELTQKPTKLVKKSRSKKATAYQSLKKDDSGDEGQGKSPNLTEGDRKGRVVSNSGADIGRPVMGNSGGAPMSSYGSYIAGLGVGRRRDVSGKVAEEGRSLNMIDESTSQAQSSDQKPESARAAGWARFAGL
ncbi:hypothetical protein N7539_005957 [Penicillium diatomitis]|uniref:Uncharacterized protein n=1 Tax=Penicillium diatomitis TaxID=2819901 RepID=A0A9W9X5J5_9EURO|nr:uncharacterized protein N7539_005957 [Penicillium diatomitis]KAJ5484161.1 hypothetical protein N7539_005957 [Penicillium diatomitis]